ncbi:Acetyltransferase (GNAT) family protein [compost metagenome]
MLKWVEDTSLYLVVATLGSKPVGVGMATATGEISLCYVLPEYFRRGLGKAIMTTLEQWLKGKGFHCVVLNSTISGYHFYKRLGYCDNGEKIVVIGLTASPMLKDIDAIEFDSCVQ